MNLLGLDIGSSSVKAAVLRNGGVVGDIQHVGYPTHFDGPCVSVPSRQILKAISAAIQQIGQPAKKVDAVGLAVMSPSWIAMDRQGRPLTDVITHQDRRSVKIAEALEKKVGKARHLHLAGNRPFPGGISSTTLVWFLQNEKSLMRQADLVGHLSTFIHRELTQARVTDPSNASFMGLYSTLTQAGWNEELCDAVGVSKNILPEVLEGDVIAGNVTRQGAAAFGLTEGTPVMTGLVDTSAAMMLTGARRGQLLNVSGSTDVLALCVSKPHPNERLLTRALGVGPRWMSVATLAAAGSALAWAAHALFADLKPETFYELVAKLARRPVESTVAFEPYLAGERTSIEQRQGAFTGLTLATTREHMLAAIIHSLATASAARLDLLHVNDVKILKRVVLSGGGARSKVFRRDWLGRWTIKVEKEATLRGLATLTPRER